MTAGLPVSETPHNSIALLPLGWRFVLVRSLINWLDALLILRALRADDCTNIRANLEDSPNMDSSPVFKSSASLRAAAIVLSSAMLLSACGGGGGESGGTAPPTLPTNPPTNPPNPATNNPPTISGTPATTVQVGQAYSFTPSAADQDGNPLAFAITNKPAWANFSTVSGALTGTPTSAGTSSGIVISVSDGVVSVPLATFSITASATPPATSSVTVNWTAPTANTDGSALAQSDLVGYTIYYGTNVSSLTQSVDVTGGGTLSRTINGLTPGTYYFAMVARTATESSGQTNLASKVVQ